MFYVPKVKGLGARDFKFKNDKKLFRETAKSISDLNTTLERRVFRGELAEKARDGKGINLNEMADIVAEEFYRKGDHISRQEAEVVAKKFEISNPRLRRAKKKFLANEHKKGIAKPYGQRNENDHLDLGRPSGSSDGVTPSPAARIPRRPMF